MQIKLKEAIGLFGVAVILILNLGTLRKQEDPIVNTQTNPILHKEKIEEIKDGEKGAPSPSFTHYEHPDFLSEPPVGQEKELEKMGDNIPSPDDEIPEQISEMAGDELLEDAWFKDEEGEADDYEDYEDFDEENRAPKSRRTAESDKLK